jgi:hypothetical protein
MSRLTVVWPLKSSARTVSEPWFFVASSRTVFLVIRVALPWACAVARIVSLMVSARVPFSMGRGCAKQLWRVCTSQR